MPLRLLELISRALRRWAGRLCLRLRKPFMGIRTPFMPSMVWWRRRLLKLISPLLRKSFIGIRTPFMPPLLSG